MRTFKSFLKLMLLALPLALALTPSMSLAHQKVLTIQNEYSSGLKFVLDDAGPHRGQVAVYLIDEFGGAGDRPSKVLTPEEFFTLTGHKAKGLATTVLAMEVVSIPLNAVLWSLKHPVKAFVAASGSTMGFLAVTFGGATILGATPDQAGASVGMAAAGTLAVGTAITGAMICSTFVERNACSKELGGVEDAFRRAEGDVEIRLKVQDVNGTIAALYKLVLEISR